MHKTTNVQQIWMRAYWNCVQSRCPGSLNVSQQTTFMLHVLDDDGRHHHTATKASDLPSY